MSVSRPDKKEQLAKHLLALNQAFRNWFKQQTSENIYADLSDGFQDYIDFVSALENRYARKNGQLLTFGSGDCGQLGHGIEEDDDLEVPFPRIVYALRDKKICGISCGGIHNAAFTESGQVFTWGCGDDGPLGRPGVESMPLLVEVIFFERALVKLLLISCIVWSIRIYLEKPSLMWRAEMHRQL